MQWAVFLVAKRDDSKTNGLVKFKFFFLFFKTMYYCNLALDGGWGGETGHHYNGGSMLNCNISG